MVVGGGAGRFAAQDLPTYASISIQVYTPHIKGLSEHFIVMDDDMLFGRPVVKSMFFEPSGRHAGTSFAAAQFGRQG